MRIIIATDIPISYICGSTNFIKGLAVLLQKRGHKVLFMCPGDSTKNEYYTTPEKLSVYGIKSLPSLFQKNLRLSPPITITRGIKEAINKFKPDVIHVQTHFFIPYVLMKIAKKLGIPMVGTNHFMPENIFYHFHLPTKLESIIKKIGWKHLHSIYKEMEVVTTPTETAANLLRRSGFKNPVEAVSNGIDLEKFHPNHDISGLHEKYKLPKKPIILYVGRLDPEKNVEDLVMALPLIIKKIDTQLVIVGRGSKEKSLKKLIDKLNIKDNVTFSGFVPEEDLPKLYCLADCFAVPGTAELQSISTMEAMASKLPIVAANAVALPELVHDGENGYLFPPNNIKVLADRFITILSDKKLREKMGEKSLEIIQAHDVKKTVKAFEDIYERAIKGAKFSKK